MSDEAKNQLLNEAWDKVEENTNLIISANELMHKISICKDPDQFNELAQELKNIIYIINKNSSDAKQLTSFIKIID